MTKEVKIVGLILYLVIGSIALGWVMVNIGTIAYIIGVVPFFMGSFLIGGNIGTTKSQ